MRNDLRVDNDKTRRCRHCGGTVWQDGDVVKCLMCSRIVGQPHEADRIPGNLGHPKLPGAARKNRFGL